MAIFVVVALECPGLGAGVDLVGGGDGGDGVEEGAGVSGERVEVEAVDDCGCCPDDESSCEGQEDG